MRKNKKSLLALLLFFPLTISGCYDSIDIDRKVFVSTIAIDVGKDISKIKELKEISPEEPFAEREMDTLKITYGYPDISKLGPGKGTVYEEKYIETDSFSMEGSMVAAAGKSSRELHLGHTKLLLFSESILKNKDIIKEILDYLEREPKINRMMYVAVVDGEAFDYLKAKPDMEQNIESYISGIMINSRRNATILPITLNEFLILLSENGNAVIPRISYDKIKKQIYLSGIGLIKDYTIIGYMNPVETSDIEILRGKLEGGRKVIFYKKHPIDYDITEVNRKITLDSFKDKKLSFTENIRMEGNIRGFYKGGDIFDNSTIEELERYFNTALRDECTTVVKLTQKEFSIDPIGFREYIYKYKPQIWNEIKNNWPEYYKNAKINIKVDAQIRRIGVIK